MWNWSSSRIRKIEGVENYRYNWGPAYSSGGESMTGGKQQQAGWCSVGAVADSLHAEITTKKQGGGQGEREKPSSEVAV